MPGIELDVSKNWKGCYYAKFLTGIVFNQKKHAYVYNAVYQCPVYQGQALRIRYKPLLTRQGICCKGVTGDFKQELMPVNYNVKAAIINESKSNIDRFAARIVQVTCHKTGN